MSDQINSHTESAASGQLSLCPKNNISETDKCNVLLVEPTMSPRSETDLLLSTANCCVTNVSDVRELFHLRFVDAMAFAILNDLLGSSGLRSAAESVRRQWPSAKILIIGSAVPTLEDHLYDDSISHRCGEKMLLEVLQSLTENSWSETMTGHGRPVTAVQESNPAKALPASDSNALRNTPGGIYRLRATA